MCNKRLVLQGWPLCNTDWFLLSNHTSFQKNLCVKYFAKCATNSFHDMNAIGIICWSSYFLNCERGELLAMGQWYGTITHHYYAYHLIRKSCTEKTLQVFQSETVLYSIHVTEQISCTFREIASRKINVLPDFKIYIFVIGTKKLGVPIWAICDVTFPKWYIWETMRPTYFVFSLYFRPFRLLWGWYV